MPRSDFDNFYNMLDDFFASDFPARRTLRHDTFKVDVMDEGEGYAVVAELPGVDKKDIQVQLNEGRLQISVEQEEVLEEEDKQYIHRERRCSSMCRSVYLEDARSEGISAKLENGLLKVIVPKELKAVQSVEIEVE